MTTGSKRQSEVRSAVRESLDSIGAADHDTAYTFGRLPRALAPFPFSMRQYARLLVMRGQVRAARSVVLNSLCHLAWHSWPNRGRADGRRAA